jgi:hypothetical protein
MSRDVPKTCAYCSRKGTRGFITTRQILGKGFYEDITVCASRRACRRREAKGPGQQQPPRRRKGSTS